MTGKKQSLVLIGIVMAAAVIAAAIPYSADASAPKGLFFEKRIRAEGQSFSRFRDTEENIVCYTITGGGHCISISCLREDK